MEDIHLPATTLSRARIGVLLADLDNELECLGKLLMLTNSLTTVLLQQKMVKAQVELLRKYLTS